MNLIFVVFCVVMNTTGIDFETTHSYCIKLEYSGIRI